MKIMGIDLGKARTGVCVSDLSGFLGMWEGEGVASPIIFSWARAQSKGAQ